jgi:ParB family chromosome partitioning protein
VSKTLETKPQLVQISSAWSTREDAPLGKNRYVELEIKKAKTNGTGSKVAPQQKPCEKMTEAVVMDGGRRGEVVKVCADPSCRVHHPDTPSGEQVAKERAEERKRIEKSKQAITVRHCVLAKVLERVVAPMKKADLLTVAQYTIGHLSYNQVPVLAKRHRVETSKTTKPPQEVLMKKISTYDEATLSRLLLEISLLDSAYQRGDVSQDLLMDAAKRFRVDVEKVEKAVAAEFAAKRGNQPAAKTKPKPKSVA